MLASEKISSLPRPRSSLRVPARSRRSRIDRLHHPQIEDEAIGVARARHHLAYHRLTAAKASGPCR